MDDGGIATDGPESTRPQRVVGIAGSLRRASFNRRLLAAAVELAPESMTIEHQELDEIPLYNADIDNDEDRPPAVARLKAAIARADGLLIATPEYNHGIPGVLKNAIDWASRPSRRSPLRDKPTAMMGASAGAIGSARAQLHLESVLLSTMALLMPHAGVVVGGANGKFDDEGRLIHQPTREFLASFLEDFGGWMRRFGD